MHFVNDQFTHYQLIVTGCTWLVNSPNNIIIFIHKSMHTVISRLIANQQPKIWNRKYTYDNCEPKQITWPWSMTNENRPKKIPEAKNNFLFFLNKMINHILEITLISLDLYLNNYIHWRTSKHLGWLQLVGTGLSWYD